MAADPSRHVYSLYARQYLPRSYVIDPEGVIAYQCTGFYPDEVTKIAALIERYLGGVARRGG